MSTMYCALCRRPVEAKRQIGIGTVILAVASAGLSLLAIPFYSKRCSICKGAAVTATVPELGSASSRTLAPERLVDLEARLTITEGELEATVAELDRVRAERDFYRELLGDPSRGQTDTPSNK